MKLLPALVAATLLFAFSTPTQSNDRDSVFWAQDGNSLLRNCDETGLGSPSRESLIYCDLWITGIRQGIELSESIDLDAVRLKLEALPPSPEIARSEIGLDEASEFDRMGVMPIVTPDGDMCVPSSSTPDQMRLVVIKWLKDNPKQLSQPASLLTFAALRNTYECRNGETFNDWSGKQ